MTKPEHAGKIANKALLQSFESAKRALFELRRCPLRDSAIDFAERVIGAWLLGVVFNGNYAQTGNERNAITSLRRFGNRLRGAWIEASHNPSMIYAVEQRVDLATYALQALSNPAQGHTPIDWRLQRSALAMKAKLNPLV